MDADSLRSRFRVLVPIYLGPIHVLACAWWAVGTWQLPDFWSPAFRPATPGSPAAFTIASWSGHSVVAPFDARAYGRELARHWVGLVPGARARAARPAARGSASIRGGAVGVPLRSTVQIRRTAYVAWQRVLRHDAWCLKLRVVVAQRTACPTCTATRPSGSSTSCPSTGALELCA